jgi:DNA-binding MarR family transcriptional regulator
MATITILDHFAAVRRGLSRMALRRLKDLKLGPKQIVVIRQVYKREQASITELADAVESDLGAASRMISSLVKGKWLVRLPHPADARQSVIKLGEKAKRRMDEINQAVKDVNQFVFDSLGPEDSEQFVRIMNKIEAKLKEKGD